MKPTWIASAVLILLLLAALPLSFQLWPAPVPLAAAVDGGQRIGGPFELQGPDGRRVTEQSFEGQWLLVFFGFTRCADVCPTTLVQIAKLLDGLGEQGARLQPLFISLDPERDTPEVLAAYTRFFDERILGLTGSPEQIRQVADAYGVYVRKVPMGDTYMLDHTGSVYLMSPAGELVSLISPQRTAADAAREISAALAQAGNG
ncbi:SCO family protein [Pseudomonas sp. G34]|uniref:SCO family protein n=1 Tax=Pseudomonas sp. G34 TaxID=3059083 RepID=UPI002809FED7|nr:SCO family protein [Pseudomonas sp. G34]MDQ7985347.1 SCO family protein [Pseudomonas sp. G34]